MKRPADTTHIGYEVGTGADVAAPLAHTFIAGQTQLSGKTTTLAAIAIRSGRPALAFGIKRGEQIPGRRIKPYLPREGDAPIHWRTVEMILASALGQRNMKFERFWIMNAARGAKSLEDVRRNVDRLIEQKKKREKERQAYEMIGEYLDLVLPAMRELDAADTLELEPGLNVIDLAEHGQQLQAMVIRACLEHIGRHLSGVLTVFPEAWEFAPRNRITPASEPAVAIARKGAVIGNYLLCDSQDIAGVDTQIRQAASVWILGVQRELNELGRTLRMMPAGIKKPSPADVQSLELGQFFICYGSHAIRTYVQPAWMDNSTAQAIAKGEITFNRTLHGAPARMPERASHRIPAPTSPPPELAIRSAPPKLAIAAAAPSTQTTARPKPAADQHDDPEQEDQLMPGDVKEIKEGINQLSGQVGALVKVLTARHTAAPPPRSRTASNGDAREHQDQDPGDVAGEQPPAQLTVTAAAPELVVEVEKKEIHVAEDTPRGRIALLIADGFFKDPTNGNEAHRYWAARGYNASNRIYEAIASLVKDGFLIDTGGKKYQQHAGLHVTENGKRTTTLIIHHQAE